MTKTFLYTTMLVIGFLLGYQTFVQYYPNILFLGVKQKVQSVENTFSHGELPTADSRFVVKPNPDFLYSTCFYNLEDGPLRLSGDLPDSSYWSIAFYEPNTVNFYVKNDQEFHSNRLEMIISQPDDPLPTNEEDFEIVKSPSKKGLILFRLLVTDNSPDNVEKYKALQHSVKMEPLK